MWFRKNVAGSERWARVIAGALMVACGLIGLHASMLGILLACAGVVSIATAIVGYCPACALAGRKSLADR